MPSLITVLKTATLHVIKATDVRGQKNNINLNKKEINKKIILFVKIIVMNYTPLFA